MAGPFALVGMGVVMAGALVGVLAFAATFAVGFGEILHELRDDETWRVAYLVALMSGISAGAILFVTLG